MNIKALRVVLGIVNAVYMQCTIISTAARKEALGIVREKQKMIKIEVGE